MRCHSHSYSPLQRTPTCPPIDSNIDVSIMIGVVVVTIMITVTSSAPCEERRLANQLNSNTDERLFVMRVIEANDKNENINITVYLAKNNEGLSN